MDAEIGKIGEAKVFVSVYVPHDTILISPKEEEMFNKLIDLIARFDEIKSLQEQLSEPMAVVQAAMAKYVGKSEVE